MNSSLKQVLIVLAAAVLAAAAATVWGAQRQSRSAETRIALIAGELRADLEITAALPAILAEHPDVRALLMGQENRADALLQKMALLTGRHEIAVYAEDGRVIVRAARNPSNSGAAVVVDPDWAARVRAQTLLRRSAKTVGGAPVYQIGRVVRGEASPPLGYVSASAAIEDYALTWRALPERLVLSDANGEAIFSNRPAVRWPLVAAALDMPAEALRLDLQVGNGWIPGVAGPAALIAALAASLWMSMRRISHARRALTKSRIEMLEQNAALLEETASRRGQSLTMEIEARQRLEQELSEKRAQLIQTEKFNVLGGLAAGLSHELSQPLFAVQTSLDVLDKQLDCDLGAARATLERAIRLTQRLARTVDGVRSFARRGPEGLQSVNPRNALDAALEIVAPVFEQYDVETRAPDNWPTAHVMAGPVRLQQVFVNILKNAAEAIADRPTRIVRVDVRRVRGALEIRVLDHGPGFADPGKALTPFYSTKRDSHGLGLGLSICDEIIADFGGRLTVDNHSDGAVVTLHLLLAEHEDPA